MIRTFFWIRYSCIVLLLFGCDDLLGAAPKPNISEYSLANSTLPINLIWEFNTDEKLVDPVVVQDEVAVYLRTKSALIALNPDTGGLLWRRSIRLSYEVVPVVNSETIFVTLANGERLAAIDGLSGDQLWDFDPSHYISARSGHRPQIRFVFVDTNRLYIVVNLLRGTEIFLIDPADGTVLAQAPNEISDDLGSPSAFFVGPTWLLLNNGEFWLLDKDLQAVRRRFPGFIESYRQPTATSEMIFTSGQVVRGIALPAYTIQWEFEDGCPRSRDQVSVSPQVDQSGIYVTTTCRQLYKLNRENGDVIWQQDMSGGINSFVISSRTGFFVSQLATLYAIDLATGKMLGSTHFSPSIVSESSYQYLAVGKNLLVVTYGNGQAFGFKPH